MDYSLIVAALAFFGAIQLITRTSAGALIATFVAVGLPYLVSLVIKWIYIQGYKLPIIENLFSTLSVVTIALQLVLSFILFKKLKNEEGFAAIIAWTLGGFILIVLVLPAIIQKVLSGF